MHSAPACFPACTLTCTHANHNLDICRHGCGACRHLDLDLVRSITSCLTSARVRSTAPALEQAERDNSSVRIAPDHGLLSGPGFENTEHDGYERNLTRRSVFACHPPPSTAHAMPKCRFSPRRELKTLHLEANRGMARSHSKAADNAPSGFGQLRACCLTARRNWSEVLTARPLDT